MKKNIKEIDTINHQNIVIYLSSLSTPFIHYYIYEWKKTFFFPNLILSIFNISNNLK